MLTGRLVRTFVSVRVCCVQNSNGFAFDDILTVVLQRYCPVQLHKNGNGGSAVMIVKYMERCCVDSTRTGSTVVLVCV